jgi:hypothetical protein
MRNRFPEKDRRSPIARCVHRYNSTRTPGSAIGVQAGAVIRRPACITTGTGAHEIQLDSFSARTPAHALVSKVSREVDRSAG